MDWDQITYRPHVSLWVLSYLQSKMLLLISKVMIIRYLYIDITFSKTFLPLKAAAFLNSLLKAPTIISLYTIILFL